MPTRDQTDYPYLRAWGAMLHSSTAYIDMRVAQAREDHAPRDVTFYCDTFEDDGRPEYAAPSGRVWRRYDHWQVPSVTRATMAACLHRYGVDPAAEADPAPQWHWLEVAEVAWRGWVLHRTGNVLGRAARVVRAIGDGAGAPAAVLWLPFTADGRLIGEGCTSAGQARQAVETLVGVADPNVAGPRVCHRQLPGGARTEDAERQPDIS
ncbi:hypothetical protein [Dactylosporangium sp. CA-092794]|uniref:hypothetical protein n=1 Tax=Dactylosporangium sp. CA-092794 TaxID=3239929 RepID=UPI003D8A6D84